MWACISPQAGVNKVRPPKPLEPIYSAIQSAVQLLRVSGRYSEQLLHWVCNPAPSFSALLTPFFALYCFLFSAILLSFFIHDLLSLWRHRRVTKSCGRSRRVLVNLSSAFFSQRHSESKNLVIFWIALVFSSVWTHSSPQLALPLSIFFWVCNIGRVMCTFSKQQPLEEWAWGLEIGEQTEQNDRVSAERVAFSSLVSGRHWG